MKKLAFIISILIILIACDNSTTKSEYETSDAKITGFDMRKCMCCGGWFIEINKDTLRSESMPNGFDTVLSAKKLPVNVNLSWKKMTDGCGASMNDLIVVKTIKLK